MKIKTILAGILAINGLGLATAWAAIVTLNGNPSNYTFKGTNTYYITNTVYISGTATIEGGAVIKYGRFAPGRIGLRVGNLDCQTALTNPAIVTVRDDDRFGAMLPDSTHAASGYYVFKALEIDSNASQCMHDLQFYNIAGGIAVTFVNLGETCVSQSLWNIWIEDSCQGIECDPDDGGSGSSSLCITNLTMINCVGTIADGYLTQGSAVNSTFINCGGLPSDDWGWALKNFDFSWCVFSNVLLGTFDVNVIGNHNGFADCSQFTYYADDGQFDYDPNSWYYGTNYFGNDWYWLTNSAINFSLYATNHYLSQNLAPVQINLAYGTVFYNAVLVNTNDFDHATWTDYTGTNLLVNLGSTNNGDYTVYVGLRGARDVPPVWQSIVLTIDTAPPLVVVTNPIQSTLGVPLVQVQGYANESLASLTFDVSNAVEIITNRNGVIVDRFFDTNRWDFSTNYFQCYDIALTNGLNLVTIHATDRAGNITTTNLILNLDYATRTNGPNISVDFPTDGEKIAQDTFSMHGQVDDPTARVSAFMVDPSGHTNSFYGQVERTGRYWVDGLPVASGTNHLTVMIADAAGNTTVTNLNILKGTITLTINVPTGMQLWYDKLDVDGTISDPAQAVWINGVKGKNHGNGTWTATAVPVTKGGVAIFTVVAYEPDERQPDGSYGNP